jgi:hypothetical protein
MSAVLEERVVALTARVDKLEQIDKRVNDLTVEIRVLSTKMALFAGAISFAVSAAMAVGLKFLG